MNRRNFLKKVGSRSLSLTGLGLFAMDSAQAVTTTEKLEFINLHKKPISTRKFLEEATLKREFIDDFLDPKKENWAGFDSELGYTLKNCVIKNGMNESLASYNFAPEGHRKIVNWVDRPCRINTYGNSFTECHQVSDGETWQEYLAAHIGEPIRNFGVGGYGVYQAYRRMLRHETKGPSAEYIILNIWSNDHFRSLDKWRWIEIESFRKRFVKNYGKSLREEGGQIFHANPWAYVRIDPETGNVVEYDNPYPTPQSLYKLCDKDHVYENFKNDFVVQVIMAKKNGRFDYPEMMLKLCKIVDVKGDIENPDDCSRMAEELYTKCALKTTQYIVEKTRDFSAKDKKKLMIFLSYGTDTIIKACKNYNRFDENFIDFLKKKSIPYIDSLQKHLSDYRNFNLSPEDYCKRYYIGHYNPLGNHFFAYAVKNEVVDWLNPKPSAYRYIPKCS